MSREELRIFFADVKLCTNISMGAWLDRNHIFRSEFSNFMKGKYNNISTSDLIRLKNDILSAMRTFIEIYQKVA